MVDDSSRGPVPRVRGRREAALLSGGNYSGCEPRRIRFPDALQSEASTLLDLVCWEDRGKSGVCTTEWWHRGIVHRLVVS